MRNENFRGRWPWDCETIERVESNNAPDCVTQMLEGPFRSYRLSDIESAMMRIGYPTLDVLLIGGTGSGKSSTINSILAGEAARVGRGADPETMKISGYQLSKSIRFWDTPGLGDGVAADEAHAAEILKKLDTRLRGDERYGFIDMVAIVVEAGIRDMGTVFDLVEKIVKKGLKETERLVIGLNQADFAMKGANFDYRNNVAEEPLLRYLRDKVEYVRNRLKGVIGFAPPVEYYSAETGYNVTRFLDLLIDNIPSKRRYLG